MTKKEKVETKVEAKASAKKEDAAPAETDQGNKTPFALIFTFVLFFAGIVGILMVSQGGQNVVTAEPTEAAPVAVETSAAGQALTDAFADRRQAMQEKMQANQMNNNRSGLNNAEPPAWVKNQREMMQKQMADQKSANNAPSAAPEWYKERLAMLEKQQAQQMQQQKQMMAQQQKWMQAQQRAPQMNMRPAVRQQPVYYQPNAYYPAAPYYGPRR